MTLVRRSLAAIEVSFVCLMLVLFLSCDSRDKYAGTYEDEEGQGEVMLELKAGGEGVWISGMNEAPFAWYLKRGELRINTREGGVIVGQILGDKIKIKIPGKKEMVFRKAE